MLWEQEPPAGCRQGDAGAGTAQRAFSDLNPTADVQRSPFWVSLKVVMIIMYRPVVLQWKHDALCCLLPQLSHKELLTSASLLLPQAVCHQSNAFSTRVLMAHKLLLLLFDWAPFYLDVLPAELQGKNIFWF